MACKLTTMTSEDNTPRSLNSEMFPKVEIYDFRYDFPFKGDGLKTTTTFGSNYLPEEIESVEVILKIQYRKRSLAFKGSHENTIEATLKTLSDVLTTDK